MSLWRSVPFPIRWGGALLAFFFLYRWLGGISGYIAVALSLSVVVGFFHARGVLTWVDRYTWLAPLLNSYAPPPWREAVPSPPSDPVKPRGAATSTPSSSVMPVADLSQLVGIDNVRAEIEELAASKALRGSALTPATFVALTGPRGTGKSTVALVLASKLHKAGLLRSDRIVMISRKEIPGLGDSYGPSVDTMQQVENHAQASLDGALVIDDFDSLVSLSAGQVATEIIGRLLGVARRHPGRLLVIATGSSGALARLDPDRRWLGQFNVRRIDFTDLGMEALREIFVQLLAKEGLSLASGAERALRNQIEERTLEGSEKFGNAYGIGRLASDVLHCHALRLRGRPSQDSRVITAEDIRNAESAI